MSAGLTISPATDATLSAPPTPYYPVVHFKAPRQPMLWAAVAYSLGIIAGVYLWRPATWWIISGALFAAAAGYFAKRRSAFGWTLALGVLLLFGALQVQLQGAGPRLDASIRPFADREVLQIVAHVTREGRLQSSGFSETRQTLDGRLNG